jgi:hypothetical protein
MRIRLFKVLTLRLTLTVLAVMMAAAATPGCEEETEPSLVPPEMESPAAATSTSPSPSPSMLPPANAGAPGGGAAASGAPRTTAEYRKAAEAGDVPSMLLLGRSHESLGQRDEARKWYARAAENGSEDAKAALAALGALAAPPPTALATTQQESSASSTTAPAAGDIAAIGSGTSSALSGPSTRRVATAPLPPGEPGKLRWIDIGAVLNYEDIISNGQMKRDPTAPRGSGKQVFIGQMTSIDGSIVIVAMGPSETDLHELTTVIRVRNKVDPGSSPRVAQAGAVAARVTADNVNQRELLEWVTQYLRTQQRSEPIFRNGWRITVSGSAAEGRPDPKPHLGTAVMIEMKK